MYVGHDKRFEWHAIPSVSDEHVATRKDPFIILWSSQIIEPEFFSDEMRH